MYRWYQGQSCKKIYIVLFPFSLISAFCCAFNHGKEGYITRNKRWHCNQFLIFTSKAIFYSQIAALLIRIAFIYFDEHWSRVHANSLSKKEKKKESKRKKKKINKWPPHTHRHQRAVTSARHTLLSESPSGVYLCLLRKKKRTIRRK